MNNEIKEIINDLQRVADRKCYPEDILDGSIAQEWIDYITNLQEENEVLREENKEAHDFDETMKDIKENLIARIQRQEKEIEKLNNIINETRKGLDRFYKEHSRLMWTEEDYIEFINCIDRELKGSDK